MAINSGRPRWPRLPVSDTQVKTNFGHFVLSIFYANISGGRHAPGNCCVVAQRHLLVRCDAYAIATTCPQIKFMQCQVSRSLCRWQTGTLCILYLMFAHWLLSAAIEVLRLFWWWPSNWGIGAKPPAPGVEPILWRA